MSGWCKYSSWAARYISTIHNKDKNATREKIVSRSSEPQSNYLWYGRTGRNGSWTQQRSANSWKSKRKQICRKSRKSKQTTLERADMYNHLFLFLEKRRIKQTIHWNWKRESASQACVRSLWVTVEGIYISAVQVEQRNWRDKYVVVWETEIPRRRKKVIHKAWAAAYNRAHWPTICYCLCTSLKLVCTLSDESVPLDTLKFLSARSGQVHVRFEFEWNQDRGS